jgi:uncharacterized membrane protein YbhN (UPF0104 family)
LNGPPRTRAVLFKVLRIALALGMLWYLVVKVGHAKPLERLAAASPRFILAAVAVVIVDGMIRAWNWTQLIRAMHFDSRVRYAKVLAIYWACSFLGQFVPSSVGTDALRAMMASRKIGGHVSGHGAAVVMLNAMNLTAGCVAGLACAAWMTLTERGQGVRGPAVILFACALAGFTVGYWLLRTQRGALLCVLRLMHGRWRKLRRGLRRFVHRLLVFERYDVSVTPVIAVAFVTQLTRATMYAMVGLAVGVVLPLPAWLALVPAYSLSGMIPYSVGGYGGDQAAIVYMVTGFGATAASALAFALIVPLMTVTFNLLGGFNLLFDTTSGATHMAVHASERTAEK